MTEDRGPDGAPAPEVPATGGEPAWEAPAAEAPAPGGEPAAPPPLAPYVAAASAPAPPPVAPPAMQPAVAWAAAPAAAVPATGQRTILAAIAGVLLLLGGILGGLLGLLVAVVGGSFATTLGDLVEIPDLNGADAGTVIGGVVAFFGIIIVVYSLVYLFAGIGVLRNKGWGRVMGLIVGILSGLIWLSGLSGADEFASASGGQSSLGSTLVGLAIHVYIVVTLLFFWRRKPSGA